MLDTSAAKRPTPRSPHGLRRAPKRIVKNGSPSSNLVLSAATGCHEDLFPQMLGI